MNEFTASVVLATNGTTQKKLTELSRWREDACGVQTRVARAWDKEKWNQLANLAWYNIYSVCNHCHFNLEVDVSICIVWKIWNQPVRTLGGTLTITCKSKQTFIYAANQTSVCCIWDSRRLTHSPNQTTSHCNLSQFNWPTKHRALAWDETGEEGPG